jgi:hypothetical protein
MFQFSRRRQIWIVALCGIVVLLLLGARPDPEPQQTRKPESSPDAVQCTEPRPQICTMEYIPVCADLSDGTRRTYASGCVACSDANVVNYRPGQCE